MYLKLFLNRKVRSVLFKIVIGIVIIYGGFNLYKSAPELHDLKVSILNWDPKFTFIAFSVTLIYIICQSFIYYFLIKNFGNHISFKKCTEIFLKRNFLSFFLPAGNISSLTFIPDSIKKNKIKTAALYHASIWYGIISLFTFFLVAIPVFILIYKYQFFRSHIWLSTVFICAQLLIFIYLIYSVYKRNRLYQTIINLSPLLNDIFSGSIRKISFKKSFWLSFIASLFVEFCGIAHINIALILITNQSNIEVSAIVYVLTVITGMISPFMKGAGLAEVAVFMFLKIIGYDVTTSILITSAFRFFEFWLPLLIGSFLFIWRLIKVAGKILPAVLLFISGVINVISAVTPPLHNRLNFLISFVPKIVSDFSTYATLLTGFILILISFYLYKGIKNAWLIAIMILSESILTNMLKAIDYEEAIISLIVLVILLITPRHYWIKSYKKQSKQILIGALWGIFALLIFGFLGLYFMDVKYFNADLTYEQAISITINSVFYLNNSNIYPASLFGKFFVYFLHFTSFLFWIILLFRILRPYFPIHRVSSETRNKIQSILEQYGDSSLDYFKISKDKFYFLSENPVGFIAYSSNDGFAIVLEAPVSSDLHKKDIMILFEIFCKKNGMKPVYYMVHEKDLDYFNDKKQKIKIGQEGIVNLKQFNLNGREKKSLRNGLNHMQKHGYNTRLYNPPHSKEMMNMLKEVSDDWLLSNKRKEMGFSQGAFDPQLIKDQTLIIVSDSEAEPVAFLNIIPSYKKDECTYDIIRKKKFTPGGVLDALIIKLIDFAKESNFQFLNMGMVPFSGISEPQNITEVLAKFASQKINRFKKYRGLRDFKEKYVSYWSDRYLIYEYAVDIIAIVIALNKVFKSV